MKILTFSHSGDAIPTITEGRALALQALGHEVLCIDMDKTPLGTVGQYKALVAQIRAFDPDFACFYGFVGLISVIDEKGKSVPLLEQLQIPFAVMVSNLGSLQAKALRTLLRFKTLRFMRLFVWDEFYVDALRLMGFARVEYLALASCRRSFFRITGPDEQTKTLLDRHACDVSFCGNSGNASFVQEKCRELPEPGDMDFLVGEAFNFFYRRKILSAIKKTKISFYGRVANANDYGANFKLCGWLDPSALNVLYNASKIALNIFHPLVPGAMPMRIFDAMAAGAMVVSDRRWITQETFRHGRDIVFFDHPGELDDIFARYLSDPDARQEIADNGQARVLESHTWKQRMAELVDKMAGENK